MQAASKISSLPASSPRAPVARRPMRMALSAVRAATARRLGAPSGVAPLAAASAAPLRRRRQPAGRQLAQPVRAMVNVDISPSVVLGVGLIGAGVSLWQIRRVKPWLSKDYDVVVSCISLLVGGILIFQGWRLDPLLLFGQLMTTGAAVSFAIEALRLRSEAYEGEEKAALQDVFRRKGGGPGGSGEGGAFQLPPPEASTAQQPWAAAMGEQQPWAEQQQAQAPVGTASGQGLDGAGAWGYGYDATGQQQPQAWGGELGRQQWGGEAQQQQPWDYSAGGGTPSGLYQPAEYDATAGGDVFASSSGTPGTDGTSSSAAGPPSEFIFPASYEERTGADGAAGSGSAGSAGPYGEQQQQWGQPPPAQPGSQRRGSSSFDGMDDW